MLERWRIPGFSHLCDILEPITILFAIIRAMGDIREKSNSYNFDNDLFLLDPASSIMINMFPESFFFDLVLLIIVSFVTVCLVCYFLMRKYERRELAQ